LELKAFDGRMGGIVQREKLVHLDVLDILGNLRHGELELE
jgi:hypothetical protein